MSVFKKVILLILVNILGFSGIALCYTLGLVAGIIAADNTDFDTPHFFFQASLTWGVCALFSLSYIFLKGKYALLFLWAPVFIPLFYGLSIIFLG